MRESSAVFSPCGRYRYVLRRIWARTRPPAVIVGLNPSTADAEKEDPTVRRCVQFARSWDYGGLVVVNLFAYRATFPADLFAAEAPIGPENDRFLAHSQEGAGVVVAAWGNHGTYRERAASVMERLHRPHYLRLNKSGQPAHPLYLPSDLLPVPYR